MNNGKNAKILLGAVISVLIVIICSCRPALADNWWSIGTGAFGGGAGISSVTPNSGVAGTTVTLTIVGSSTNFSASSFVDISGSGVSVVAGSMTIIDSTHMTVNIAIASSANTGPRNLTVTTGSEVASGTGAFTITASIGPAIAGLQISREADAPSSGVIISWTITPVGSADVWSHSGQFTTEASTWAKETTTLSNSWRDSSQVGNGVSKYYKVMPGQSALTNLELTTNVVGKVDVFCDSGTAAKYTLISTPLEPFSGDIKTMFGSQLSSGVVMALSDQLISYQSGGSIQAWLRSTDNQWVDPSGNTSTMPISTNMGYWVRIKPNGTAKYLSLVGSLPEFDKTISLSTGYNLIGSSFPIPTALANSGLAESGATKGAVMPLACQVIKYLPGSGTYEIAWLNLAGNWVDSANNPSSMRLDPGYGYWIKQPGVGFNWSYFKPY